MDRVKAGRVKQLLAKTKMSALAFVPIDDVAGLKLDIDPTCPKHWSIISTMYTLAQTDRLYSQLDCGTSVARR